MGFYVPLDRRIERSQADAGEQNIATSRLCHRRVSKQVPRHTQKMSDSDRVRQDSVAIWFNNGAGCSALNTRLVRGQGENTPSEADIFAFCHGLYLIGINRQQDGRCEECCRRCLGPNVGAPFGRIVGNVTVDCDGNCRSRSRRSHTRGGCFRNSEDRRFFTSFRVIVPSQWLDKKVLLLPRDRCILLFTRPRENDNCRGVNGCNEQRLEPSEVCYY